MTGFLGTKAGLQADLNLVLHLVILALIFTGFMFARRRKFSIHEKLMFTGIILAAISLLSWMGPSYVGNFRVIISEFTTPGVLITNIHVVLGVITGTLALYIVLLMKKDLPDRFAVKNVKRLMRTTFALWFLTFAFGLFFYIWYYIF